MIPCDVLFVGEAPGYSEDTLGIPFCGPAGHLLDEQIEQASPQELRLCFTNLVCCIPKDATNRKVGEPSKECIKACSQRLQEFYKLCRPRAVILVGDLAAKWFVMPGTINVPVVQEITHPAAILRADIVKRPLMHKRVVVTLRDVFEDLSKE